MGTLFMLPPDFDAESLNWPNTRAIARTLKVFGARLIDATGDTFGFAGERGSTWSQWVGLDKVWHTSWPQDLTRIRDSLRPVVSTPKWLDADGNEFSPVPWEKMNLLSMRGPWTKQERLNSGEGSYETTSNSFLFSELSAPLSYRKVIQLCNDKVKEPWFQWMSGAWYLNPLANREYRLRAEGFGEATATLEIRSSDGLSTSELKGGQEAKITWPGGAALTSVIVRGYPGPPSGIRLSLELI
jgi:hypothetical protein